MNGTFATKKDKRHYSFYNLGKMLAPNTGA
mgnify:CR=1 FL=1